MILLTGATGFLGAYILLELLEQGQSVRAIRRKESSMNQVHRVFRSFSTREDLLSKVDWTTGNLHDLFSLENAMQGVDTVVHCAGLVSFQKSDRTALVRTNAEGTAHLVNTALRAGVRRVVYVSSIAALGRGGDDEVITEKTVWKNSKLNSNYAISKYGAEKEIWRGQEEGLEIAIVNPAILLGYGDPDQGSTQIFQTVHQGLSFYPKGINGFVGVRDTARAVSLLADHEIKGERFILSAANLSYLELFSLIAHELGLPPPRFRVGSFLGGMVWPLESFRCIFTGKEPLVTRETIMTALQQYLYDGSRISKVLPFRYTSLEDVIHETGILLKKDFNWQDDVRKAGLACTPRQTQ